MFLKKKGDSKTDTERVKETNIHTDGCKICMLCILWQDNDEKKGEETVFKFKGDDRKGKTVRRTDRNGLIGCGSRHKKKKINKKTDKKQWVTVLIHPEEKLRKEQRTVYAPVMEK